MSYYVFTFLICILVFGFHDSGVGGEVALSWPKFFPVAPFAVNFFRGK